MAKVLLSDPQISLNQNGLNILTPNVQPKPLKFNKYSVSVSKTKQYPESLKAFHSKELLGKSMV